MTGDPHVLAPGQAPTPFTAAEIRDDCAVGKVVRVLVEIDAEPPYQRVTRYVECDDSGATLERSDLALDGTSLEDPEIDRVTWLDLQGHAAFPADDTVIASETIDTPLGELDCMRYTVQDGPSEKVLWFAKGLPGMPVRFVTQLDGTVGMTVSVVEIVP